MNRESDYVLVDRSGCYAASYSDNPSGCCLCLCEGCLRTTPLPYFIVWAVRASSPVQAKSFLRSSRLLKSSHPDQFMRNQMCASLAALCGGSLCLRPER